jgi:hypothetical protein
MSDLSFDTKFKYNPTSCQVAVALQDNKLTVTLDKSKFDVVITVGKCIDPEWSGDSIGNNLLGLLLSAGASITDALSGGKLFTGIASLATELANTEIRGKADGKKLADDKDISKYLVHTVPGIDGFDVTLTGTSFGLSGSNNGMLFGGNITVS